MKKKNLLHFCIVSAITASMLAVPVLAEEAAEAAAVEATAEEETAEEATAEEATAEGATSEEATAEEAEAEGTIEAEVSDAVPSWEVSGSLEDGIYTISIKATGVEKEGWYWENYIGDKGDATLFEVVTDTTTEEGYAYVGSFRAIEDEGEDYIRLAHTDGYVVDEYMDFNIRIEGGQIVEEIGGSSALPNNDDDLAAYVCGNWQDANEGNTFMEISQNPQGGFDGVISDGSGQDGITQIYTFHANYDVISEAFKYRDGGFHDVAITDGSEEEAPAEEEAEAGTGEGLVAFDPASSEEDLQLILHDLGYAEEDVTFVKAAE